LEVRCFIATVFSDPEFIFRLFSEDISVADVTSIALTWENDSRE
jgi:hypothetical protein